MKNFPDIFSLEDVTNHTIFYEGIEPIEFGQRKSVTQTKNPCRFLDRGLL